ncbi:hypothetical protein [Serpentinicella alkaliphila]|nr:hypothetical protein [Serpentinicella alkaliphila]
MMKLEKKEKSPSENLYIIDRYDRVRSTSGGTTCQNILGTVLKI